MDNEKLSYYQRNKEVVKQRILDIKRLCIIKKNFPNIVNILKRFFAHLKIIPWRLDYNIWFLFELF